MVKRTHGPLSLAGFFEDLPLICSTEISVGSGESSPSLDSDDALFGSWLGPDEKLLAEANLLLEETEPLGTESGRPLDCF